MRTVDLCGTWRFRPDGGAQTTIEVPGFWEAQGHLTLDGRATYERDVELDADAPHATLEFDAVADLCDVYVNDEHAGSHEVGFTPFSLDVHMRKGTNKIRVEVVDPPVGSPDHLATPQGKQGWANRFFPSPPSVYITYGGIWQPCRLVVHKGAYIEDLWCDMDPDDPKVGASVRGDPEVTITGVEDLPLWSAGRPALGTLRATVDGHERTIRTALRRLARDGDDLLINGKPYRMRSALHQGFWPDGLYAADPDLIKQDVRLALDAGLNTLRTHLKAFEPAWLDAADEAGLLLQCDTPIGEPLGDESLQSNDDFIRRCVVGVTEQVRRDRSRPSIIAWTLMNEVGLRRPELLDTDAYRSLIAKMTEAVRALDPSRPIIENDWVDKPKRLVTSDIRTPHWYGRTTKEFLGDVDARLERRAKEPGPLYVTEFGEWGLPSPDRQGAFWEQDDELAALIKDAGWPGSVDELIERSQEAQGWADRIQAERFRTHAHVRGFCLTEWTDVPHELNGLVTLRRAPKRSVESFRPALADVAPIAVLDRYAYAEGEEVEAKIFLSNWSGEVLPKGELVVSLGEARENLRHDEIESGGVAELGTATLAAASTSLRLRAGDAEATYPLDVGELPRAELGDHVLEDVPTTWGPTPIIFTTGADARVLYYELFHSYPRRYAAGVRGPVMLLIPPPIARWGAVAIA